MIRPFKNHLKIVLSIDCISQKYNFNSNQIGSIVIRMKPISNERARDDIDLVHEEDKVFIKLAYLNIIYVVHNKHQTFDIMILSFVFPKLMCSSISIQS